MRINRINIKENGESIIEHTKVISYTCRAEVEDGAYIYSVKSIEVVGGPVGRKLEMDSKKIKLYYKLVVEGVDYSSKDAKRINTFIANTINAMMKTGKVQELEIDTVENYVKGNNRVQVYNCKMVGKGDDGNTFTYNTQEAFKTKIK